MRAVSAVSGVPACSGVRAPSAAAAAARAGTRRGDPRRGGGRGALLRGKGGCGRRGRCRQGRCGPRPMYGGRHQTTANETTGELGRLSFRGLPRPLGLKFRVLLLELVLLDLCGPVRGLALFLLGGLGGGKLAFLLPPAFVPPVVVAPDGVHYAPSSGLPRAGRGLSGDTARHLRRAGRCAGPVLGQLAAHRVRHVPDAQGVHRPGDLRAVGPPSSFFSIITTETVTSSSISNCIPSEILAGRIIW